MKGDFEWSVEQLPEPEADQVRIRTIYLSLDPSNRVWCSEKPSYLPPVEIGAVMSGLTMGVVEASRFAGLKSGDIVSGFWGFRSHVVLPGAGLAAMQRAPGVGLDAFMSVLGVTGMTAYFGLLDIAKPKAGETLVVSAAAGAVGSIVGQIGKLKGLRVVGTAGSDEKCEYLTKELGFDAAINYKSKDLDEKLKAACPAGVDIYFDNTGGPMSDAVLKQVNLHARMPLCGLMSTYNDDAARGPMNYEQVVFKRVTIQGFIISDYVPRFPEGIAEMMGWLAEGKIKYRCDIVEGLERAVEALGMLFSGSNTGKLLVRCSPEPAP